MLDAPAGAKFFRENDLTMSNPAVPAQQLSISSGWYEPVATVDGVEPNQSFPAALRSWRCECRHGATSSETLRKLQQPRLRQR
jgi:hypothetical protein